MTLTDYQVFAAIAEYKSITLAADTLCLTKSAVSHALSKMENELGVPLFDRGNKSVRLTEYGSMLLPYAEAVLQEHNKFGDRLKSIHGMETGTVRIGTCSSICSNWIPDIVRIFQAEHPEIEVIVRGGAANQNIIEWLLSNEIDIGIGTSKQNPQLDIDEVYDDEMICITPPSVSTQKENVISAEEMRDKPFMIQEYPFNEEVLDVLDALKVKPTSYITGYDDATLISMTESGLGYCIQGKLVMKRVSAAVNVYSFEPKQYRHFAVITRRGMRKSPAVEAMIKLIKKYASEYPSDYELDLLFVPKD